MIKYTYHVNSLCINLLNTIILRSIKRVSCNILIIVWAVPIYNAFFDINIQNKQKYYK